jgi:rRNA maturation protein Nop10
MATMLYHCPDCNRLHDEPADATYALSVVCLSCALEREVAAPPRPSGRDLVTAA